MKTSLRLLVSLLLAGAVVAAVGVGYLHWRGNQPVNDGPELFVIQPGSGIGVVSRDLAALGVIDEPYSLLAWAYFKGYTKKIQAGEYRVRTDTTLMQLLEQFVRGDVIQYQLTLVEGWNFRQVMSAVRSANKLRSTLTTTDPEAVMALLGQPETHPEGRFFPDTYRYTAGTTDLDILARAMRAMDRILAEEWQQRDADLMLDSPAQALVLASIIEKETGLASERGLIAGVFHNRLRRGMRLQTDPTVIYGLGESFDGDLTRAHLRRDTPYNTYTRHGLPPTPIAMPGRDAIRAALQPEQTSALYFVARGDGSHQFSETLDQHNRAVAQYQLSPRKRR